MMKAKKKSKPKKPPKPLKFPHSQQHDFVEGESGEVISETYVMVLIGVHSIDVTSWDGKQPIKLIIPNHPTLRDKQQISSYLSSLDDHDGMEIVFKEWGGYKPEYGECPDDETNPNDN